MDAKNKIWELWLVIKLVKSESIQGIDNLFSKVTDNETTFRNALTTETNRAEAAEQTNAAAIANNKSAIDILNGDSTVNGSVKKAIKDVVGAAPEALDTLEEIAKQLESDESTVKALTNTISEETTRAKTAEEVNANNISTNATNLSNEITRAKAAEKANATSISSLSSGKVDKTTTVNGHALSGNITVTKGDVGLGSVDNTADSDKSVKHATSADNDGSGNNIVKTYATITNLTAETSRAKSAEETNASNLSNEITRAKAAESTLQTSVSKNKSAIDILNGTSDVEGSVKKAIKDVVDAAPEALNTLGEIATELTNHESAAAAISTAITNETTRAKAAEKTNADAITALNNRIKIVSITNSDYTTLATKDANTLYCIPE